jgi:hypothetical protein
MMGTNAHDIDPIAHLSALDKKLDPVRAREEYTVLKPALLDLYLSDRATFAVAAELVKEKLGIGRRDLEAGLRPLVGDEDKKGNKPLPLARFPELVDLVEEEGEVRFLMRSENCVAGLRTEAQWEMDGRIYIPPGRDLIPWLLPRAERVIAAYETDDAASLYADLNRTTEDWHRGALADTARVVTSLEQSARTFCAKSDDSGYSPG